MLADADYQQPRAGPAAIHLPEQGIRRRAAGTSFRGEQLDQDGPLVRRAHAFLRLQDRRQGEGHDGGNPFALLVHAADKTRRQAQSYKLHIGMAVPHLLIEGRLGERVGLLQPCAELGLARQQRRCGRGKLARPVFLLAYRHQPGGG